MFDPCFANSTGEELACVADPWAHGVNRNDPGLPPWYVELADGARCVHTSPSTYRCSAAPDAAEPVTTRPVWTVQRGPVRDEVRTAWC